MDRILYFDCFAGISGDMTIAALIDLGLDPDAVIQEIRKLNIYGYEMEIKKKSRYSIWGTDVKVKLTEDHSHMNKGHEHRHEHSHNQEHGHNHDHDHEHKERSLADISHIIQASEISSRAKDLSIRIFTEIARAEAAVHGKKIEEIHFHEVGAIDSIVDIVGAAICIDMLKVDKIYCSPVHEGQGFINCRHGRLPVPVPAVVKMLEGSPISIVTEDIEAELVTPTGMGILKTITDACRKMPELQVEAVGYGFGKTETGRLNALRVILGTTVKPEEKADRRLSLADHQEEDTVSLLETNIDDITGETLGYTMTRLFEAGALDVFFTPIYMKKNRPAYMLSVICRKAEEERLSDIIFRETSTIGIRIRDSHRITLKRKVKTVITDLGEVRVKSYDVGGLERVQPEYEDCIKLANENNISLNEIYEIVKRSYYGKESSQNI